MVALMKVLSDPVNVLVEVAQISKFRLLEIEQFPCGYVTRGNRFSIAAAVEFDAF